MSENIRVRSILGRLEHSRLFILESSKKVTYLLGSADLMPRNLDHRLEIVVPVEDSYAQQRLSTVFDALLADNAQAWELGPDGLWERLNPAKDERPKPAQAALVRSACALPPARRAVPTVAVTDVGRGRAQNAAGGCGIIDVGLEHAPLAGRRIRARRPGHDPERACARRPGRRRRAARGDL